METQIEIHTFLEKKHYVEYYRYIWRRRIIWVILYVVVGSLGLLLNLGKEETKWTIYGCVLILYAVWLYFRPWQQARKTFKKDLAFENGEKLYSVTKFGDEIVDETPSQSTITPYEKIEKIHITKELIFVVDIRKAVLIMDKNGFVKGTFEDFLPFIQEKCPQLNLPKW